MEAIILMTLLVIKHFIFDYPLQTQGEIDHKGTYGNLIGVKHSAKHGLGTFIILLFFVSPLAAFAFACFDFTFHYHIDWAKKVISEHISSISKLWWVLFGIDQLLHSLTYIAIIANIVIK